MGRSLPKLKFIVVALVGTVMMGCARENTVYTNPNDPFVGMGLDVTGPPGPQGAPGRNALPEGIENHSVNRAIVDTALDGGSLQSKSLRIQTAAGVNAVGAFNGSGTGSKAMAGFSDYNDFELSQLNQIEFEAKSFAGSQSLAIQLQVDLNCDGSVPKILVADASTLGSPVAVGSGFQKWSASSDDAKWKAVGAITDPGNPALTLIPSHLQSSGASLNALLTKYPFACLVNVASGDAEMPKGLVTSGILLVLGDSTTTTVEGVYVRSVHINDDDYSVWE